MKNLDKARELAQKSANRLNKVHYVMRTVKGDLAVEREDILSTPFGKGLYPAKDQMLVKVEPHKK